MTDTKSLRTEAGYTLRAGRYVTYKAMIEAANTIDTLRAQLAEAQRELIAKESERAGLELERNNAQRQHTMQCAINKADSQRILELTAQLAEAQRDSERLDWLDKYCTGASDSERYLPRKVYWSGGTSRDVRVAIDAAKGEAS